VRGALVVAALAAFISLVHAAPPAPRTTTILFVGNSFTHGEFTPVREYNRAHVKDENARVPLGEARHEPVPGPWSGIPGLFARFTEELGLAYDVHAETISGQTLDFHLDVALPVIAQAKWDVVVLQEYSTFPLTDAHGGHRRDFQRAADRLEAAVHAKNRAAKIFLYETFPRADLTYRPERVFSGEPIDTMANELQSGYSIEFQRNGKFAGLAPVGDAWIRAIHAGIAESNPYVPEAGKIDLWNIDAYHPSNAGAYLSACVLFERITGIDARRLGPNERAAADLEIASSAIALQQIAHQQIEESDARRPRP
jgi:hypothetical protein